MKTLENINPRCVLSHLLRRGSRPSYGKAFKRTEGVALWNLDHAMPAVKAPNSPISWAPISWAKPSNGLHTTKRLAGIFY